MKRGAIVLMATSTASDMQQDRSTGWRLGTNRVIQFRYQAAGILVGALLAVAFARLFMAAYPVLSLDQTTMTADQQPAQWNAAMTFKFVGVLKSLTDDKPYQRTAIWIGVATGLAIEMIRKVVFAGRRWQAWRRTRQGAIVDFVLDSTVLSSPYGVVASLTDAWSKRHKRPPGDALEVPADMTGASLFGGGLIAGDAIAALALGLIALGALVVS